MSESKWWLMTSLTPREQRYFTRKRIYKIIKRERAFLRLLHNHRI